MKRINIYITEETDQTIDNLSEMMGESRSEVIRNAISEYHDKYKTNLDTFMEGLEGLDDPTTVTMNVLEELTRCRDLEYFIRTHVKIKTVDHGIVKFEPYKHQVALAESYSMYRRIVINHSRQMGISVLTCAYILHDLLFNTDQTYAIVGVTEKNASHTLSILKTMIEELPEELKQCLTIDTWNKKEIKINGNYVLARPISVDGIRGMNINFMYLEDFAYTNKTIADDFMTSVFPVMFSSNTSKLIISSTPNGANQFYHLWSNAISDYNNFRPITVHFSLYEDEEQINRIMTMKSVIGQEAFNEQYDCKFNVEHKGVLYGV